MKEQIKTGVIVALVFAIGGFWRGAVYESSQIQHTQTVAVSAPAVTPGK